MRRSSNLERGASPLTGREQTRNIVTFASVLGLNYLAAPVLYVGLVQASLLDKLGASKALSNAPLGLAHCMAIVPVLVAWFIPQVRHLKTVIETHQQQLIGNRGRPGAASPHFSPTSSRAAVSRVLARKTSVSPAGVLKYVEERDAMADAVQNATYGRAAEGW